MAGWLKLYTDILDDPKMADFTPDEFAGWIWLLLVAREANMEGTIPMSVGDLAWRTRRTLEWWNAVLDKPKGRKMVTIGADKIVIRNYQKRQSRKPSDQPEAVRERVRRHRSAATVTRVKRECNAPVTPLDPEVDPDPEVEERGSPPAPPQGAPRRARPVFEEGTEPYRLAQVLRDSIIDHLGDDARVPGPTPADLAPWAREFDLMIRVDHLDPPRIEQVLRWARADPFWQGNILSAGTFRKQWMALVAKMSRPQDDSPGGGGGGRGANRSGIDRSKLNDLIVRG